MSLKRTVITILILRMNGKMKLLEKQLIDNNFYIIDDLVNNLDLHLNKTPKKNILFTDICNLERTLGILEAQLDLLGADDDMLIKFSFLQDRFYDLVGKSEKILI